MNYANSTRKAIGQAKPKVGDLLADWNVPLSLTHLGLQHEAGLLKGLGSIRAGSPRSRVKTNIETLRPISQSTSNSSFQPEKQVHILLSINQHD